MAVPEVATRWDLDSSMCEGVKGGFIKLKTTLLFSSSSCSSMKHVIIHASYVLRLSLSAEFDFRSTVYG